MYLTYNEYIEYGGTLEESAFEQLEFEARAKIDYWTFNRLQNDTDYPEAVKRCMYKLIYMIDAQTKQTLAGAPDISTNIQAGISSESNDGVSTVYSVLSAKEAVETIQKDIETTIQMYLQGVKNSLGRRVLYRGIYPNE